MAAKRLPNKVTHLADVVSYVRSEHKRWRSALPNIEQYDGQFTIGMREVLEAHFLLAEFFATIGEGIGGIGPKDTRLLESALSRQFSEFGGKPKWNNRIQLCATLMYGLIKNHPFHDANKRTAFLTSILHLQKIGRTPTTTHQVYEDFTVDIADNKLGKYKHGASDEIRDSDECVHIIAEFLRKNTREIDLRVKQITFNELAGILRLHGMELMYPKGNHIDVVRVRDPETGLEVTARRIAHIGFHGWTKEVSRKDLHIIRSAAKLDAAHGYDAQAFFNGVETPLALINKYREPLERLAYR